MGTKLILGAALGNCVHVAGLHHFLQIAESEGFTILSLGPAVSVERLIQAIKKEKPVMVAVSYRLTPAVAQSLFLQLKSSLKEAQLENIKWLFGGPPPVAEIARQSGLFDKSFDGTEPLEQIRSYLQGGNTKSAANVYADNLIDRIARKYPYPLIRHHFGRPTLEETINGARQIAEAGVLDVLSIGPDQNAQEYFFQSHQMDHSQDGAGGVPLRKQEDIEAIYSATRTGNFPLVRCYAGTRDMLKWAEMSVKTIHNAWAAIPLCWYSVIDGRSKRTLEEAISEHQTVMQWYAQKGIPVEVNEAHQWSLRDAHDAVAVAMAFLAAYNAKKAGVKHYVSQFMFNTPPGTSATMDIAKMLAKKEMIEELEDENFKMLREVRAGLSHFSPLPDIAKGQLAASAVTSLALKPHILHVVGYSEGDHAVYPDELIESCNIIHGVLRNALHGFPDVTLDTVIEKRKNQLKNEARLILQKIKSPLLGKSKDALSDPIIISKAIKTGILDAPHFKGNPHLCGNIFTRLIDGAWYAIDYFTGEPIDEETRLSSIIIRQE